MGTENIPEKQKNLSKNDMIYVPEDRSSGSIKLYFPIDEVDELSFRRAKVKDAILAEKLAHNSDLIQVDSDPEFVQTIYFLTLMANLCEITFDDISELDEVEDLENLSDAYNLLDSQPDVKEAKDNPQIEMSADKKKCRIKLIHPIKIGKKEHTELTMVRPKLKHSSEAQQLSKYPQEQSAIKYAALCNVSDELMSEIDIKDDFESLDQAFAMFRRKSNNKKVR